MKKQKTKKPRVIAHDMKITWNSNFSAQCSKNEVLLEQSPTHSFRYCPWHFVSIAADMSITAETLQAAVPKILTICHFPEKVAALIPGLEGRNSRNSSYEFYIKCYFNRDHSEFTPFRKGARFLEMLPI